MIDKLIYGDIIRFYPFKRHQKAEDRKQAPSHLQAPYLIYKPPTSTTSPPSPLPPLQVPYLDNKPPTSTTSTLPPLQAPYLHYKPLTSTTSPLPPLQAPYLHYKPPTSTTSPLSPLQAPTWYPRKNPLTLSEDLSTGSHMNLALVAFNVLSSIQKLPGWSRGAASEGITLFWCQFYLWN